jgi:hypothetical protein
MLSLIVYLLFCRSILAAGLESQVTSSAKSVQDISVSTSELAPEITVEVQAGTVNFSGVISLIPTTSTSTEQTAMASSGASSLFIPVSNQTLGGNGSMYGSTQPTASGSSLMINQSVKPQAPTASLIAYTGSASRDSRLYRSRAALLFVLGVIQM